MTQAEWIPTNKYKSGTKKDPMSKYVKLAEVAYAEGCKDTATKLLEYLIKLSVDNCDDEGGWYLVKKSTFESMLKQLEEQK